MFWEYFCDYEQLLINTIVKGLNWNNLKCFGL